MKRYFRAKLWVLSCCFVPLSISFTSADEFPLIPVCKDGTLFHLPQHDQLYSRGKRIAVDVGASKDSDQIFWKIGQPPLDLAGFYYNGFGGNPKAVRPILDLFLGRSSDYKVRQLSVAAQIGHLYWFLPVDERPNYSHLSIRQRGRIDQNKKIDLKMFDGFVSVICRPGLPVYSEDPASNSCRLGGLLEDGTAVSVSFSTGSDLEGHWPSVAQAEELWPAVISELEEALQNLQNSKRGDYKCS